MANLAITNDALSDLVQLHAPNTGHHVKHRAHRPGDQADEVIDDDLRPLIEACSAITRRFVGTPAMDGFEAQQSQG